MPGTAGSGAYLRVPDVDPVLDLPAEDFRHHPHRAARMGVSKILARLHHQDTIDVEKTSVYGSALAMPQLARSAGWPLNLTFLALRSYLFLLVNILCQGACLYLIDKSEEVIDKFSGQMYICDFGASVRSCPSGTGCTGPGGTMYAPAQMYGFNHWLTRNFLRDSLISVFPNQTSSIMEKVQPGEYGQESHAARSLCCFLFMASLMSELTAILNMSRIFFTLPSYADSWIQCDPTPGSEVKLRIAGMPLHWKFVNFVFIFVPKLLLWRLTASAGINFLLDTGGITDVIINTVALSFIIEIDEMLFACLVTPETLCLMNALEGFNTFGEAPGPEEMHQWLENEALAMNRFSIKITLPLRMILVSVLTFLFVTEYYVMNCMEAKDGTWISQPQFVPDSYDFPFKSFLLPAFFPQQSASDTPYWTMPVDSGQTKEDLEYLDTPY